MTEVRRYGTPGRKYGLIFVFLLSATGCASVFHGTKQRIAVFSEPAGATASVGDQRITTPGTLVLPRRAKSVEVRIVKDGYVAKTIRLDRKISGTVWWNAGWIVAGAALGAAATQGGVLSGSSGNSGDAILVGGIGLGGLGFFVDFKSGAAYRLEPATLVVKLEREEPRPPPKS